MKRADSFYGKERVLIEIQHMKQSLDILERNVKEGLDFQDTTGLKENIKNWNRDVGKLKEMIAALELTIETLAEENPACKAGNIPVCGIISEEESIKPGSDKYGKEEFREQVSAFVESMTECVDDFADRISAYESEEELYEDAEIAYPEPCDYGSEEYEYPMKAKAKTACKEAVEDMIRDVQEMYREERDHITSYASEYFSGLEEKFCEFVNEFLESYDEYASLECENEA